MFGNIGFKKGMLRKGFNINPFAEIYTDTVTINSTYIPNDLSGFVVSLDLSLLSSTFFSNISEGGSLRTYTSDDTEIAHELVYVDTDTSSGLLKIRLPSVSGSVDTAFKVVSSSTYSDYSPSDTYGRNAVYTDYSMVQNLHTTPDLTQVNSTGNTDFDMTSTGGMISTDVVTAKYGGGNAVFFNSGSSQGLIAPNASITSYPFSMGCWFRTPNDELDEGSVFHLTQNDGTGGIDEFGFYKFGIKDIKGMYGYIQSISNSSFKSDMASTNWVHAVFVCESATHRQVYYNGVAQTANTSSITLPTVNRTCIGVKDLNPDLYFGGDLVVSDAWTKTVTTSAAEITANYNNTTQVDFFTVT